VILDTRPPADGDGRTATHEADEAGPWGVCDLLLIADRGPVGTHRFYRDWRFEAVMRSGRPEPGTVLFAAPLSLRDLSASGQRYQLRRLEEETGSSDGASATFSWAARPPTAAVDPLADALGLVRAWLAASGWEPDPANPTRYHG
jgi:hypothetical protein